MQDVALYKAQNNQAIEDITREKLVISKAVQSARAKGLDPESIEGFFKAQIAVAKAIQYRYRADLLSQPVTAEPRDLTTVIRPALIDLSDQIINSIIENLNVLDSLEQVSFDEFDQVINLKYVSFADKQLIFQSLKGIKLL